MSDGSIKMVEVLRLGNATVTFVRLNLKIKG